jgi:hypothetical protein
MLRRGQPLVGEQGDPLDAQRLGLLAGFAQAAMAVGNGGHVDREGFLPARGGREIMMTAGH